MYIKKEIFQATVQLKLKALIYQIEIINELGGNKKQSYDDKYVCHQRIENVKNEKCSG